MTIFRKSATVVFALVFAAGVSIASVIGFYQNRKIDTDAKRDFERLASRTELEIGIRFAQVTKALKEQRGLFLATKGKVSRNDFRSFALSRDLEHDFPGVKGIGYIEKIERTAVSTYVANERADDAPQFSIRNFSQNDYPDLFVVKFFEPDVQNGAIQGLDIGSDAVRRAGVQQAINTGAETITGLISLVQGERESPGLLLYVPVYRQGAPLVTPKDRRAALLGVLFASIAVDEILEGMPDVMAGTLDIQITDAPINSSDGVVMYESKNRAIGTRSHGESALAARYSLRKPLQLPGRNITLTLSSTKQFEASIYLLFPWMLFGGGFLMSALLTFTLFQLYRGRSRAEDRARDMTKDLHIALNHSKALLDTLNLHSIVSIADRSGRILEVNDAFCEVSGFRREELIGQSHRIINSSVHHRTFWNDMWKTISKGAPWRGQVCNKAKDGSLFWADTLIAPFTGVDGKVDKYIAIRANISEIKKAEWELGLERQRLHTILDNLGEGVYTLDTDGRCNYINAEARQLLGWTFEELSGRGIHDLIHHHRANGEVLPSDQCSIFLAMQNNRIYKSSDEVFFRKDGTAFPVEMIGSPLVFEGRRLGSVAVFRDISESKLMMRRLEDAKFAAESASTAKSQFLANMSHEIRTPMNAILGMLSLLHKTELTPQQLDYADKSESAANSLLALINDILDFSKVEAGKMLLDPQPFRMDQLMRDLAVILSANVRGKGIEVLYDIDKNVPPVLVADALRLQQILTNLGGNAIKFTPEGQVVIGVHALVISSTVAKLRFEVKDSGIGIAPENQARIFSGFTQAEASTTRKFGGTGLGLAISRRMVELMGGELELDSTLGQGSTFSFSLDLPLGNSSPKGAEPPSPFSVQPKRVLVIDDNVVACELMARMTRSWNWPTEVVHSGEEALALVESKRATGGFPFDVIYIDWDMPGIDGWETMRILREVSKEVGGEEPIIVMVSASGREALSQRTVAEQALLNGFLVKPVTASMLLDATLKPNSGQAALRQSDRTNASLRRLRGMRILVVEDNQINQQVAEELLLSEGAHIALAANGQLGVDAVAAADPQFDAVLMDIQMPVLDGYAATRAIRTGLGLTSLPIIAMTANAMAADREECLAAGMNEHVGKPFNLNQLVNVLLHQTGRVASNESFEENKTKLSSRCGLETAPLEIDLEAALSRMSGMKSLYLRSAREFVKTLPDMAIDFRKALSGDRSHAVRLMHTLKGTSSLLGAVFLAQDAATMEILCKSDADVPEILQQMEQLENQMGTASRSLCEIIAQMERDSEQPCAGKPQDELQPHGVVELTPDACRAMRTNLVALDALLVQSDLTALEKFSEIRSELTPLSDAQLEPLENALQSLELEEAHAVCLALIGQLAVETE